MLRGSFRRAFVAAAVAAAGSVPAFSAFSALSACGSDPYSESPQPTEASTDSATADAPTAEAAAPADPCSHVVPSSPPAVDDAPGVELPPFFIAVRTVSTLEDGKRVPGFDLDGVCTCDPRPETAHAGTGSCLSKTPSCDGDGGIDNAVSTLATQLSPFFAIDSVPNSLISAGRRSLLVQIGKYNGRLDDKEVAVGLALSDGVRTQGCPTSVFNAGKGIYSPGWCGDDAWTFLPDSVIPATKQPLIQGVGYVRDGVLTLQLTSPLLVPFNEVSVLALGSAALAGKLTPLHEDLSPRDRSTPPTEKENRLWALEGATVSGRLKATDLLGAVGTIEQGDGGSDALCLATSQFAFIRSAICGAVDISASKALDFDPGAQCDSLSVALAFTAFPALPGEVHGGSPSNNPCIPGPSGEPPDAGTPYSCATK